MKKKQRMRVVDVAKFDIIHTKSNSLEHRPNVNYLKLEGPRPWQNYGFELPKNPNHY